MGETWVASWKDAAVDWAGSNWDWRLGGAEDVFSVAVHMGWTEVGDALARNRHVIPSLLLASEEEPCLLHARSLILAWSLLAPSDTLERFLATALKEDIKVLMGEPFEAFDAAMGGGIAESWAKQVEVAMAIAWKRCRKRAPGPAQQASNKKDQKEEE